MALIITVFGCLSIAGLLLLWLPFLEKIRTYLAGLWLVIITFGTIGLLISDFQVWTLVFAIFSLYHAINLMRVMKARIQPKYLYNASLQTAVWLLGFQAAVLLAATIGRYYHISAPTWLYVAAGSQLAAAAVIAMATFRNVAITKPSQTVKPVIEHDLPTLTVALPARNETDDLDACLQSLVSSTYPKLEILVLDDCSQNKRTPEIIRSFAQAGVRFIAGQAPPKHWLAKNYAYQQLADEANGELLLFCGVDTRFKPDSLRTMVEIMLQEKKTMLSWLPRNEPPSGRNWRTLLIQPARYAWELSLPRTVNRPPVLSTCWLITAEALRAAGSFKAVSRGHSPESYFARLANRQTKGYAFLQSTDTFGLASAKNFQEQQDTAIRTRYPQLHRRPELAGLMSLAQLSVLELPFWILLVSLIGQSWWLTMLSGVTCLLLTIAYARIVNLAYRRFLLSSLWLLPIAALFDMALLNYSMWQYEFREVIWKGRNICIPVMRLNIT